MIRKPTLLVLLCAVILGGGVYFFDWKNSDSTKSSESPSKAAFSVQADDITSLVLTYPAQQNAAPVQFEKQNGSWEIVQPIETGADDSSIDGIVDQIASAQISQSEPGTGDRRKAYGLDSPQISIEFQLRNGAKHTLLLGKKDFTGDSVYTVVDGGQSVSLLPVLILTSADKSLDDLRDRDILHIDPTAVSSFTLKGPSGALALAKQAQGWKFTGPHGWNAGQEAVDSLLQAIATAKMTSIASEKPENLPHYGLSSPVLTFDVTDSKGMHSTLLVGRNDANGYFARDAARPMIFVISEDTYQKLSKRANDLRDKRVLQVSVSDIRHIQINDPNGAISLTRKGDIPEEWVFDGPDSEKGKSAAGWKILEPMSQLTADQVIDGPDANLVAQLKNPAFTAVLTDKSGKSLTLRISRALGDFVYAQTSEGPELYKLAKQALDDLNLKLSDLAL
jgi:hypothetical protein